MNALLFLRRTRPNQVAAVGRSFEESGWVDASDVKRVLSGVAGHSGGGSDKEMG